MSTSCVRRSAAGVRSTCSRRSMRATVKGRVRASVKTRVQSGRRQSRAEFERVIVEQHWGVRDTWGQRGGNHRTKGVWGA